MPSHAQQGPNYLNIAGNLFQASGAPVTASNVSFKLEIYDKSGSCLLYSEIHSGQDLSNTRGGFSLELGHGSSIHNEVDLSNPAVMTSKIFENSGTVAGGWAGCLSSTTFHAGDNRVIRVQYDLGGGYVTLNPDVPIGAAAYSIVAETLQGKRPPDFIQVHDDVSNELTQANVENVFSSTNYPKLDALLQGTSTQYILRTPTSAVDFNNQLITNVAAPVAAGDAANKNYVDGNIGGKIADLSGIGPATGDGYTLIWDKSAQKWTTGTPSVASSPFQLNGTNAYYNGGNVGIGTSLPDTSLNVSANAASQTPNTGSLVHLTGANNTSVAFTMDAFGSHFYDSPYITLRKAQGTAASPSATAANDILGDIQMFGWQGGSWINAGEISVNALENWTSTNRGTNMLFTGIPVGNNTTVRFAEFGNTIGLGYTSARNKTSWTTVGATLAVNTGTITDTTGSGAIANRVSTSFSAPTYASTNPVTVATATNVYIAGAPAQGANTTLTKSLALQVASGDSAFQGNVGIGTTAPANQLHVAGTAQANSFYVPVGGTTSVFNAALTLYAPNGSAYNPNGAIAGVQLLQANNTQAQDGSASYISATARNSSVNNQASYFGSVSTSSGNTPVTVIGQQIGAANYIERLRIDQNGNVGIGTTSPSQMLHVAGNISSGGVLIRSAATQATATDIHLGSDGSMDAYDNFDIIFDSNGAGAAAFRIKTGSWVPNAATELFRIDKSGNVGIGTTTPQATLDVNGTVRLAKNSSQPFVCDAAHDGAIALTHLYQLCVCNGGTLSWQSTVDGATACSW
jgi:hypothetical protein